MSVDDLIFSFFLGGRCLREFAYDFGTNAYAKTKALSTDKKIGIFIFYFAGGHYLEF